MTTKELTPARTETLVLSDGAGDFAVKKSDGSIEVLSGYPNVGHVFRPGNRTYDQVVKNLAAVSSSNALRLKQFLGIQAVEGSLAAAPVMSGGRSASTEDMLRELPVYQQWWFWPVAVPVGAVGVAALAYFAYTRMR